MSEIARPSKVINHIAPQKFAEVARLAQKLREESWNANAECYDLSKYEAVNEALKAHNLHNDQPSNKDNPSAWFWPIYMFIHDGYTEADMWIEEQLGPAPNQQ